MTSQYIVWTEFLLKDFILLFYHHPVQGARRCSLPGVFLTMHAYLTAFTAIQSHVSKGKKKCFGMLREFKRRRRSLVWGTLSLKKKEKKGKCYPTRSDTTALLGV